MHAAAALPDGECTGTTVFPLPNHRFVEEVTAVSVHFPMGGWTAMLVLSLIGTIVQASAVNKSKL